MGMRTVNDPYGSPAVLVDHMLGNAYEVVRFVAVNVEYIKHVSAHMQQIYRVDASLAAIDGVIENLAEIDLVLANITNIDIVANDIDNVDVLANSIQVIINLENNIQTIINAAAAASTSADISVAAALLATQTMLSIPLSVASFADLANVTPAQLAIGATVVDLATGARYVRVASGGDLNYSAGAGVRLEVKLTIDNMFPANAMGSLNIANIPERAFSYPILLVGNWVMTASRSVANLHLVGGGATITGYNGLGFRLTAGSVILDGDLTIQGFEDGTIAAGPGGENNGENYAAAFCRINTAAAIEQLYVLGGQVKAKNCRSLFTAGSEMSDLIPDKTITIQSVVINGLKADGVMQSLNLRCIVKTSQGGGNSIKNAIGSSRLVCGIAIWMDGLPANDAAYALMGSHQWSDDVFHTLVNRTTTGNSTPGNNFETHAYMLYGNGVLISNPMVTDCTGTNFDCEAIYTKAFDVVILGGVLKDAGSNEGTITIKGNMAGADLDGQAPGGKVHVIGTIVEFTRYSYLNDSTTVTFTDLRAGTIAATADTVVDITAIGCKSILADLRLDGYLNATTSATVTNPNHDIKLRSVRSRSRAGLVLWGSFHNLDADVKATQIVAKAENWATIRKISVVGRGTGDKNHRYKTMTQMNDVSVDMTGFSINAVDFDNENHSINGLVMCDSLWDVTNDGAQARPISFDAQTGSPTGLIDGVDIRGWTFVTQLNRNIGPIRFDGSAKIRSGRIDLTFPMQTLDSVSVNAMAFDIRAGSRVMAMVEATATLESVQSDAIYQPPKGGLFYNNAGTATAIGSQTTAAAIGSGKTATVSAFINTNGANIRWQLNGDASEVWNWVVHAEAVITP